MEGTRCIVYFKLAVAFRTMDLGRKARTLCAKNTLKCLQFENTQNIGIIAIIFTLQHALHKDSSKFATTRREKEEGLFHN